MRGRGEEGKNGKMPSEIGFMTEQKQKIKKNEKVKGWNDKDILLERTHGSAY